jgi:hypothetical protein
MMWNLRPETHSVKFTWHDPYTFSEWRAAMSKILAHPEYEPGFRFLVDRRGAPAPSATFITQMANFFDAHRAELQGVRAALIVRDDAGFGMGRMTELMVNVRNPTMAVRVFRDAVEAERWLTTS